MLMSVVLASLILTFAVMNIVVTIFAIISVGFVVSSVAMIMVLKGWEMGASESIAMVVIIGFSVDYVCHLAAHYVHSAEKLRYERTTESIRDMGVSIFSGGMTTFGSSLFLAGGTIMFFEKFSVIMLSTVALALMYALLYFQALCHAFGPQHNFGNMAFCIKKITRVIKCKGAKKKNQPEYADKSKNVEEDVVNYSRTHSVK